MKTQRIFSGIQPSGNLHIGNYIGAIKQWVGLQNLESKIYSSELLFFIVDLHAITVYQDPEVLREKNLEVAALYLACGLDPEKSKIFLQSENPDHPYLAWIFDCITPGGWLNRMTQFKEKNQKQKESTTVGLYNYPVLMAADILLYDADLVPVGEDQVQHIELTRDIAEKFNKLYCHPELDSGSKMLNQVQHDNCVFKLPKPLIDKEAARVMSLQNPLAKMSKSDIDPLGTINLLDSPEDIDKKVKRAVTDSETEIIFRQDKPAVSNLLVIYSKLAGKSIKEIEALYQGKGYGNFKTDLAEVIIEALKPIQTKYHQIRQEKALLDKILDQGRDYSLSMSGKKLLQVKQALGLGR